MSLALRATQPPLAVESLWVTQHKVSTALLDNNSKICYRKTKPHTHTILMQIVVWAWGPNSGHFSQIRIQVRVRILVLNGSPVTLYVYTLPPYYLTYMACQGGIFTGKVGRIFQRRIEKSQEILIINHALCHIFSSFLS